MKPRRPDDRERKIKERAVLLERFRSEILRESGNRYSLAQVRARVMHAPQVLADPVLADALRSCLAEREAGLADVPSEAPSPTPRAVADAPRPTSHENAQHRYHDLVVDFDHATAEGSEATARSLFDRVRALGQAHPDLVDAHALEHFTQGLANLAVRRQAFEGQIEALAQQVEAAAAAGDHETTARIMRRLSGIHSAYPASLPDARLKAIGERIVRASDHHEHRLVIRDLVQRERDVAEEIRRLATAVHRFHVACRRLPHDSETLRRAEETYKRLVAEVRAHDVEWYAALIVELADFLAEWDQPPPKAQHQVDHFLDSVRSALHVMRSEIRQIEQERAAPSPASDANKPEPPREPS